MRIMGHGVIFKGVTNNCQEISAVTQYEPGFGLCGEA